MNSKVVRRRNPNPVKSMEEPSMPDMPKWAEPPSPTSAERLEEEYQRVLRDGFTAESFSTFIADKTELTFSNPYGIGDSNKSVRYNPETREEEEDEDIPVPVLRGFKVKSNSNSSNIIDKEEMLSAKFPTELSDVSSHKSINSNKLPKETYEDLSKNVLAYLDTKEDKYLFRFFFKSGIIRHFSSCIGYTFNTTINPADMQVAANSKTARDVASMKMSIIPILDDIGIHNSIELEVSIRGKLTDLVYNLYITHPRNIFRIIIDTKEIYLETLSEFRRHNIPVDPAFLALRNIDFRALRSSLYGISVIYSEYLGELIVSDTRYDTSESNNFNNYYSLLKLLPTLESKNEEISTQDERITINGIEYSKRVFENIVESDMEEFLSNLELETYVQDNERSIGAGDNDSRKIKLL
jgi:hypothetical protein